MKPNEISNKQFLKMSNDFFHNFCPYNFKSIHIYLKVNLMNIRKKHFFGDSRNVCIYFRKKILHNLSKINLNMMTIKLGVI